jgi:PAS domain S-box-containing protein
MAKNDYRKTKTRLIAELDAMRQRVAEIQGEQVPSESEERYRRLVQLMPDAVRVSCNGRVVYVNEAAARLFGAENADQLIGRKTDDFVLPEDLDEIDARRRMVCSWDGPLPMEEQRRVRLDGTIVPVEISSIQINWQGKPAALTVMRDISGRIQARSALEESERRLAAVAENIPGATYQCVLESNGRFKFPYVSHGVRELFGLEPQEIMAKGSALLRVIHRDDRKVLRQTLKSSAKNLTPVEIEMRVTSNAERPIWVRTLAQPRRRPDGVMVWEGMFLDVTERRLASEALQEAKESAESANRAKTDFLAVMSHELRTPLNAIMGFSEIIEKELFGPVEVDRYREYAADIHTSGTHLLGLINDVLDLSKIEAGKFELEENDVDIGQIIESSVRALERRTEKGQIRVSVKVPNKLPHLLADERKVKQIMQNLLSNASKFTPDGGSIMVSATASAQKGMHIRIADTGIGIRKRDIDKVLSPFGQIENAMNRQFSGTGLGLPLAKSLVEQHGGRLELESRFGRGTTITVAFPPMRLVA